MTVLFGEAEEAFGELLPEQQRRIARLIELLADFPLMYPVRRRGIMLGYRYFVAGRHLVYY